MSTAEPDADRPYSARDAVGGFLIATSIALGGIGIAHLPVRLIPAAIVIGLVGVTMTGRFRQLGVWAMWAGMTWWVLGMTIAVVTDRPLY